MTDRFRPAARMADIAPFHVMEVMGHAQAAAAAGRDIVHMEVGEPDFATAEDRKSTRLNSSHIQKSRMPSSA